LKHFNFVHILILRPWDLHLYKLEYVNQNDVYGNDRGNKNMFPIPVYKCITIYKCAGVCNTVRKCLVHIYIYMLLMMVKMC